MNIDRAAPDLWSDYFEPGGEPVSVGVQEPATASSPAAECQPVVGKVKLCLDDGTYIICMPDGTEILEDNGVFPSLRPEYPVVLYPDAEAGWSLSNPSWRLIPSPLTLHFIRDASGLAAKDFATLVNANGFAGRSYKSPLTDNERRVLDGLLQRELSTDALQKLRSYMYRTYADPVIFTLKFPLDPDAGATWLLPG